VTDNPCRQPAGGFTLVEAVISLSLVSLMLVTAMHVVGQTAHMRHVQSAQHHGQHLAHQLMTEILQQPYTDPEVPMLGIGLDGERATDRAQWDDVDDYDGWLCSPPQHKGGEPMPEFTGWTRAVVVDKVTLSNPMNVTADASGTGLKRIEVAVLDPAGVRTSITALRSRVGVADRSVLYERASLSWIGVDLQLGADPESAISTGTFLLNEPPDLPNLLENPGFEDGKPPWFAEDAGADLLLLTTMPHGGWARLSVERRSRAEIGLGQDVTGDVVNGRTYYAEAWVKTADAPAAMSVQLVIDTSDGQRVVGFTTPDVGTTWTRLTGTLTPAWTGSLFGATWKVRTELSKQNFSVDDVVLREVTG